MTTEVVIEQPKQAANVVTSENLSEFMTEKLGLEIAKPAVEEEVKPKEEPAEKVEEEPKEKPSGYKKLLAQRNAERDRANRIEAELNAIKAGKVVEIVKPTEFPGKPDQSKYTDAFKYAEDLAEWKVNEKLAKQEEERKTRELNTALQKRADSWKDKEAVAHETYEDYDEVMQSAPMRVSNEVRDALLDSDYGPDIAYLYAKDTFEGGDLLEKLNGMTIGQALRAIGRMEAKLEKEAKAEQKESPKEAKEAKKEEKEVSKATPPITPLKAVNAPQLPVDDKGEFTGSIHEFKKLRREGKLR